MSIFEWLLLIGAVVLLFFLHRFLTAGQGPNVADQPDAGRFDTPPDNGGGHHS
jgi:hypothetical protein